MMGKILILYENVHEYVIMLIHNSFIKVKKCE